MKNIIPQVELDSYRIEIAFIKNAATFIDKQATMFDFGKPNRSTTMDEIKKYLAEEIAIDHYDGFFTRREALRRLGLLGLSAAAASTLLASCQKPKTPTIDNTKSQEPTTLPTEAITFAGQEGRTLQATWASAKEPRGALLVIHENKGLTEHFRAFPGRLAAAGYASIAVDLLSAEGGTASLGEPANATAALGKVAPERFLADSLSAFDELEKRAPGKKIGAMGFCFGGGMTWRLIASKDPRLAAAVPFYGRLPEGADFTGSKAAVLGMYAELDARVNESRDAAKAALEKAGLTHEIMTYQGADHAFFNDTGQRYNANAATEAWKKTLSWFAAYIG
jgi:carboxymethylenebutenolidase